MMRVIQKQDFGFIDSSAFLAHKEIQPLCVQRQGENWSLWYETWQSIHTASVLDTFCYWRIHIIGTGQPFSAEGKDYICTCQDGVYVWHFYLERV